MESEFIQIQAGKDVVLPMDKLREEILQLQRQMNFLKMKKFMKDIEKPLIKLIDKLDSIPEIFTDGFRGIMLLKRTKDGQEGNAQRKSIKRISRNTDEWKTFIRELREFQQTTHQGYRIYSSVNERDITKAIHEFKRRQLETDYGNVYEFHTFYCDIKNRFFSCLMNPNARAQNNFLIDCDTQEEYEHAKLQLRDSGLIIMQYPTKNGWHIITRPFNPNDYGNMQIGKDELIFIG
jgi:hypothetical protein